MALSMFHTRPEELTAEERKVITDLLWKEMREIYYGRNIPAVLICEMPGGAFACRACSSAPPDIKGVINAAA
ncbi:hypothetical protein LNQ03_11930 [Klebsiella pneumoniae subsp. pneumoniae]|nr:hypothetical protein [Klebsiella pneumoniae subsp. pneumoniae]